MPPDPSHQGPILRPHEYDGIQEYDQKLPNWWLFSWYITMVFFVIAWVGYYQFGLGMSDEKNIETAMAKIADYQKKELELIDDDKLWEMSKDEKIIAAGAATYSTTCVACHAADLSAHIAGAKLPGLPLNDQEWKHGGTPTQLLTIVRKGAPDVTKGMPPWEPQLGLQRVVEVVAFVLSKHQKGEPVTLATDSPLKVANP
ncbi:cbb3-type cytochrome c oxidase N-terminal domain-containing protein [Prosthecobacter dejongeii]|uniref:Cytochrome c oxidase cbb3-type subunit 3 n=1 Tax=Prosthecobacter dejongeii TaxID=48465 RepID=A0A7W7YHC7_9BACT|nr:cbb3-type cytochrome c oxidase N-terminal domain-containing protein [Prosthecobacter dejongeii]MBB5036193.1 cytochrome c oxidase cbb3-type subunit 3 [Prosthecobacter dejongeii]